MARRMMQGIGVPEAGTVGPGPTLWNEPKPTPTSPMSFSPANAGTRLNYGSTPGYVDTMPARWETSPMQITSQRLQRYGIQKENRRRSAAARMAKQEDLAARERETAYEEEMAARRAGTTVEEMRTTQATAEREKRISGRVGAYITNRGIVDYGNEPEAEAEGTTETPSTGATDSFLEAVRRAPAEPMESPVEWREDPDMAPLGLPRRAGEQALESWLRGGGAGSAIVPPAGSRAQRRPKTV